MLPYLPPPYPDELLYSICARYHQYNPYTSEKQTLINLFGSPSASAIYDFPGRLSAISSQLPLNTRNTPERLLRYNTMFPLYEPFLPLSRSKAIANGMIGTAGNRGIHNSIGVMASSVPALQSLRFCPACVSEEILLYGEPYWHRAHQVPGVYVCHRHGSLLKNSEVIVVSQVNKHHFISAYHGTKTSIGIEATSVPSGEHIQPIAAMAFALLNNTYEVLGLKVIQQRYINILRDRGLASVGGRVPQRDLILQFAAFYGDDFLAKVGCSLDLLSQDNWLNKLVRAPRTASHPLRHLLLIHFLGMSLDEFINCSPAYFPFGIAPWPCLNPVAEHFHQQVIENCIIGQNCETKAPTGTFSCECGFVYCRSGPDKCLADRYKSSRVVSRGPIWEQELLRMVDIERKSMRSTAKHLRVTTNTVIKHLRRIRMGRSNSKPEKDTIKTVDLCRKEWLQLIADNYLLSLNKLRQLKPALYKWLYRNDLEWILKNPTRDKPIRKPYTRVDWEARDRQLAEAARIAVTSLFQQQDSPHAITISKIGKMIGELALLQRHLDKLPETKSVLMTIPTIFAKGKI
jgi:hypothetical protein